MRLREAGYRILGRGFDYLLHTRPAEWPILTAHFLTGSALSLGLSGVLGGEGGWQLVVGTLAFVVGLNGGTLALNSAFDRDEGDIAYLRKPPPPPPGLSLFGLALMFGGLAAAAALPAGFLVAYAACLLLSILYSVPPVRLKAVAGADWVVNMAGFGFLTPYAGWALTGRAVGGPGLIVLIAFAALFGALYPLTQLYQVEEDTRRGDRTLAVRLGISTGLGVAIAMTLAAFAGFGVAAANSAWAPPAATARWLGLGVALAAWLVVLLPWWLGRARHTAEQHQAGMHRALLAWAITDVAVLFAWAR